MTPLFIYLDLYTFDVNLSQARETYDLVCDAYKLIMRTLCINAIKGIQAKGFSSLPAHFQCAHPFVSLVAHCEAKSEIFHVDLYF